MTHPFEKLLYKALKKSTTDDNLVLEKAAEFIEKGYAQSEVCSVLLKLEKSLIDDNEAGILREAREEICDDTDDNE
jgi:hypothetical protein